ncbi:MAG: hypothetical protein KFH87_07285 [Bacteroidetes bacterium]|nr:hypothetical protein [Bacteroidota bacterium]
MSRKRYFLPFLLPAFFVLSVLFLLSAALHAQPQASFYADVTSGAAPLSLQFSDQSTPADSIIYRAWDLDGDGNVDSYENNPRWTYEVPGRYTITLIVRDSTTADTAVYVDYIEVHPVEDEDIVAAIRLVEYGTPRARYIELWGYEGSGLPSPIAPVSIRMPLDSNGYAHFYRGKFLTVLTQNITDLLVLDEQFTVLGKAGFSLPYKDLVTQRRRDALVFLHNDLVSYQQHPREAVNLAGWVFPTRVRFPWLPQTALESRSAEGDPQVDPLYQTTVLLPPACYDSGAAGYAQYRLAHVRPEKTPLLLLPEMDIMRDAWGADTDIITPFDTLNANFNGKRDYAWTSYSARLQRHDHAHAQRFDVWEYYYPPDQHWEESAWLFARDLDWLLQQYDTSKASIVTHGVGGLLLRAYLEGHAHNYTSAGARTSALDYRNDVGRTALLGTPHAGRLLAGLAYAGPDALPQPEITDRHAPVLRELMPGREALQRLNPTALPADVHILNISGSAPLVTPPLPVESELHDDGRTALSSTFLRSPQGIDAVLGGYAARMLGNPDDAGGRLNVADPALLPRILYAFTVSDTTFEAWHSAFLFLHTPDSTGFARDEYQLPGMLPLRTDVGIATLTMTAGGQPFPDNDRLRLRLDRSDGNRLYVERIANFSQWSDGGLFFYPTTTCFSEETAVQQLTRQDPVFFTVSRQGAAHPFRSGPTTLNGYGWQLPPQQHAIVPDPFISRKDDLGRSFDITRAAGDLLFGWTRARRNALVVGEHAAMLLDVRRLLRGIEPVPGEAVEIEVDCLTDALTVLLNDDDDVQRHPAWIAPDGTTIDASAANDTTIFFTSHSIPRSSYLTVLQPAQGTWRLLVDGDTRIPAQCRVAVIAEAAKQLHLTVSPTEPLSRQEVTITLALDTAGPTATGTSAICLLVDSTGSRLPIGITDDGVFPDSIAGDGIYTGTLKLGRAGNYRLEGFYDATAGGCSIHRSAVRLLSPPPSLELLAPVGREEWRSGSVQRIQWQGIAPEQVILDFSADGGVSWTEISVPLPAAEGEYLWEVPGFTSTECRIRIRDAQGTLSDEMQENFTVYLQPVIDLIAPDGGEEWQVGSTQEVFWHSIAVDRIDLAYSTDNGATWLPVESGIGARLGGYSWQLPYTPSDSCLLRIVSNDDNFTSDISDAPFRITAIPAVSLRSPDGGERWRIGSTATVRWYSVEIDSVRIELSVNAGVDWEALTTVEATVSQWDWTIPDQPSEFCLIRLTAVGQPGITDMSDSLFAITPEPFLTLLTPVGGERWEIGSIQEIRWQSAEITSVDIEYTLNNGQFWTTAAINVPAAPGSYTWSVPVAPTDNARIRLSDTHDSTRFHISPLPFHISEAETRPTLIAPVHQATGVSTQPRFRWYVFEGALSYQLQATNDVSLNEWTVQIDDIGTTSVDAPELAKNTLYFWRVRAVLPDGTSEWSAIWRFTTSGTTLAAPAHAQPLDGAIGIPVSMNLWWHAAEDADAYQLQVATDLTFGNIILERSGLTGLSATVTELDHDSDYWWRLRSGNTAAVAFSDWSRPWKFSTAPDAPRQLTPFDGLPDVPVTALLNWYPVLNARSYRLQLATDHAFEHVVFDRAGIAGTSIEVPGLWSYWTYYWRLNVTTARGTSDWNRPWRFRTVDIGTQVAALPAATAHGHIAALWPQPVSEVSGYENFGFSKCGATWN